MTLLEKKTTTESVELYKQSLEGNNYSPQSMKAYLGDIGQFVAWLKTRRVDFDIPSRIARLDLLSAPLAILLVCCHINRFRRASSGGEVLARRRKEERWTGLASRGL